VIPLRDENPAQAEPVVTRALIAANVAVFLFELVNGSHLRWIFYHWGLVPVRITSAFAGSESPFAALVTVLTSMFLHGGWLHLIGNMWYLWIFGDNVEDRLGHGGYLLFYLASGVVGTALHVFVGPDSPAPTVGASGAIAGVLGAYAVLYPRARVVTLVPLFFFLQVLSLPSLLVLGLWFVVQFFSGALSIGAAGGGTAWWVHVGGFVFGMAVGLLARPDRGSRAWVE
jgi:membrane associated rhomboid family serine protease